MNKKYGKYFLVLISPFIGIFGTKFLSTIYWICFEETYSKEARGVTIGLLTLASLILILYYFNEIDAEEAKKTKDK